MRPALTPGAHAITVDSIVQRYHVHGAGPVCVVHPGGPGVDGTTCGCRVLKVRT